MIAGFIFLRLRGILGKKTGHKESVDSNFPHDFLAEKKLKNKTDQIIFDEKAKEAFLKGAKIAYETVITNFASGNTSYKKHISYSESFGKRYVVNTTKSGENSNSSF